MIQLKCDRIAIGLRSETPAASQKNQFSPPPPSFRNRGIIRSQVKSKSLGVCQREQMVAIVETFVVRSELEGGCANTEKVRERVILGLVDVICTVGSLKIIIKIIDIDRGR